MTNWTTIRHNGIVCMFDPEVGYIDEFGVPSLDESSLPTDDDRWPPDTDPTPFRCDGEVEFWQNTPERRLPILKRVRLNGDIRGVCPRDAVAYLRGTDTHYRDPKTGARLTRIAIGETGMNLNGSALGSHTKEWLYLELARVMSKPKAKKSKTEAFCFWEQ